MRSIARAARAGEWWEHKLAPVLGTGYALAFATGASLLDSADTLLLVLAALAPGALYVSVLNDLTDRESDRLAGAPNRLAGRAPGPWWALVAATLATGAAIALIAWRDEPGVLAAYAGAWIAFALYSTPPARLKARGAAGVLADAAGAHLFPHLVVALAILGTDETALAVAVAVWAFAHGVRGALWHQLSDRDADTRSGLRTFGRMHPQLARKVGTRVAFPLELAAFVALLVLADGWVALALLPPYALLELRRARRWDADIVVVTPAAAASYRIALNEFYVALYPLAFLIAAAVREPLDLVVLAVHVVAFPRTLARLVADVYSEFRWPLPAPHPPKPG